MNIKFHSVAVGKPITILIADDHALIREALRNTLEKQSDFKIIAEASDGEIAVKLAKELKPDVIIMDITMPRLDGLEATKIIRKENPEIKILVLTMHCDDAVLVAMLKAGADGFLTKNIFSKEIVPSIRALIEGKMVLSPEVSRQVITGTPKIHESPAPTIKQSDGLTSRELEILRMVANGISNKGIASKLFISERTVKGHLAAIFSHLYAGSRTEAVVIGLRKGLLTIDDIVG
jgi:DNA-binding NarL/FixJ family response regulator